MATLRFSSVANPDPLFAFSKNDKFFIESDGTR